MFDSVLSITVKTEFLKNYIIENIEFSHWSPSLTNSSSESLNKYKNLFKLIQYVSIFLLSDFTMQLDGSFTGFC